MLLRSTTDHVTTSKDCIAAAMTVVPSVRRTTESSAPTGAAPVFTRMDAAAAARTIGHGGLPRLGHSKGGYGPLARNTAINEPAGPEYLALPQGFGYVVFSKVGDTMTDGTVVPRSHDGMGAFALPGRRVRLIRNHDNGNAAGVADRGVLARAWTPPSTTRWPTEEPPPSISTSRR